MHSGNEWVEVNAEFIHETDGAVMIDTLRQDKDGEAITQWIPKSLIEDWDDDYCEKGDSVEINVRRWFAEKEGLV